MFRTSNFNVDHNGCMGYFVSNPAVDMAGKKPLTKLNSCFCREFHFHQIGFFLEKCLPENLSESKHWILIGMNPAGI